MIFNIKMKCFYCGKIENYTFLNEYVVVCPRCFRHDIDFEVTVDKDYVGYEIKKARTDWGTKKPKQNFGVGDYFFSECTLCSFKGILYKNQIHCPVCTKKSLKKIKEVNLAFGMIVKLWDELNKYLDKVTQDKFNQDAESQVVIYDTVPEGLPKQPLTEKEFLDIYVDGEIIENETIVLDDLGIPLIDTPKVEDLYEQKK